MSKRLRIAIFIQLFVGLVSALFMLVAWQFMENFENDQTFLQMIDNPFGLGMFVLSCALVISSLITISFLEKGKNNEAIK